MIVFSLTLFLFSSFTFFYKIRISKKPRTPRSTSWWVCLFKRCQCSRSRCTEFLCWFWGGMSQVSPLVWILRCLVRTKPVPSTLPECQRWREHSHVTSACVHGTHRGIFPGSPLPLCQACFHLPSGWQRAWAAPRSTPAGSRAVQAPLEATPKPNCRALPSLRESWSAGNAEKGGWAHLSGITCVAAASVSQPGSCWWQVPSAIPVGIPMEFLPRKELSSCRSATNYSWCSGVFSPVAVRGWKHQKPLDTKM